LSGFTKREALQLGAGMMSPGEVGLILAAVGLNKAIIDSGIFSPLNGVVIITTLLIPSFLRFLFLHHSNR